MVALLYTHSHPPLHSWSSFSALIVTLLYTHSHLPLHSGHPHSLSPFTALMVPLLMVTLLSTHGHPSLHSWSPLLMITFSALMTHGHPSLHSWSPFSTLMVTLLYNINWMRIHDTSTSIDGMNFVWVLEWDYIYIEVFLFCSPFS